MMSRTKLPAPMQLTLAYAILAGGWIVFSDLAVALIRGESVEAAEIDIGKGSLFVLISSVVLYRLAVRVVRRVREAEQERTEIERAAGAALARANRLYETLARANAAALTAKEPRELCEAICRTLVESAEMRLAWIGWVDEPTQVVHLAATAGPASDYVEGLLISADPARPEAQGPSGQSIIHRRSFVCEDTETSPLMVPWRTRAREHGLRSSAAVPLRLHDGTRGTLTIYAAEPRFFTREILGLVEELAADLAHGLEVIEVRASFERQAAALRESKQRWQFALEGAGDGVWDLDVPTGKAFFSPRLVQMFGYAPEDFHGRFEEWEAHVHPADLVRARRSMANCLAGRTELLHDEYRIRCRDGSYRWVLDRGKVVERDAFGQPLRMIGTFADISEMRRTHERLALLETALQAMPAGIIVTDQAGAIEWANEGFTKLTGYTAAEALGQNLRLLKSGRQPTEFYTKLWQTILRGEVWSGDLYNRRKDGTEYQEHMIIAPVSYGGEGTTHFVAIKQDITEHRTMEQQLLRAQRMEGIGLLAGGIAHDLNNVLAPIMLSVELLRMRCEATADRRTLEVIEAAARRGTGVVRQVLTFARGIDGERAPLRPRDLIRELVLMIEETFPRDIEVRRDVADDAPMIRGDTTQLHQVLLNLAVNARDAMPNGGILVFGARRREIRTRVASFMGDIAPGSYVVISVRDNGQGMTPEVRERIFDPFFTTKPHGKGTGLGLPTALGIVRSHGGYLQVDSRAGAGSEFRIFLPAMPEEKTASLPPIEVPTLAGDGRTVLVCDDEGPVREVAGLVLRECGFKVLEAGNGREALTVFLERREEIKAVLIDIMMPLMTGDRAVAEMLRVEPTLPVVFMSGLMDQDAVQSALRNVGAAMPPLLRKPFTAADLLTMLGRVLEPSPARSVSRV